MGWWSVLFILFLQILQQVLLLCYVYSIYNILESNYARVHWILLKQATFDTIIFDGIR